MSRVLPTIAMAVLMGGCASAASSPPAESASSSSASGAPSSSASAVPSAAQRSSPEPSVTATPSTNPAAGRILIDELASVVTNDLVVRSLPEISPASAIDPVTLSEGDLLFVLDGPVTADGFEWYRGVAFEEHPDDTPHPLPGAGWVAAGRAGETWIGPWSGECPGPVLEEVWRVHRYILLACFGDQVLEFDGIMKGCEGVTGNPISPGWLVSRWCVIRPADVPSDAIDLRDGFEVYQDPPQEDEVAGQAMRVTGHFDDPVAQMCVEYPDFEPRTPPDVVVLSCRASFVATEIAELDNP